MRYSLAAGLLLLTLGCDETLDRSSTKQPAPRKQSTEDSGPVTISGSTTASEGESIELTANVADAIGNLDYDWSLDGRGSLVSRQSDPKHATVIASSPGTLFVTVTIAENGVEIGSASLTLRITD
jgi:hypothetical protein